MENYVFISYSSQNKKNADAIREHFLKNNIPCWMAPYDIPSGDSYASNISDAIQNCSCFFLLLTKESMVSQHVERELDLAVNYNCSLITLKLGDFQLNNSFRYYLGNSQIIEDKKFNLNSEAFLKVYKRICILQNKPFEEYIPSQKPKRNWIPWVTGIVCLCIAFSSGYFLFNVKSSIKPDEFIQDEPSIPIDEPIQEETDAILGNYLDFSNLPKDGDVIIFGTYEQDGNEENGPEPIEWIAINLDDPDSDQSSLLLVSKYVLDFVPYNENGEDAIWKDCSLRQWLNNYFFKTAFSMDERLKIRNSVNFNREEKVKCLDGKEYLIELSEETYDNVFILRNSALENYASQHVLSKRAIATPYAWYQYTQYYNLSDRQLEYAEMGYSLRNMSTNVGPYINEDGRPVYGESENSEIYGIRPSVFVQ